MVLSRDKMGSKNKFLPSSVSEIIFSTEDLFEQCVNKASRDKQAIDKWMDFIFFNAAEMVN